MAASPVTDRTHRDTIFVEDAPVLSHSAHGGDQYVLRVFAPQCAANARPGQFAHVQCDPLLPMRRPISIMRASVEDGWVDFLYKNVGYGTGLLSRREAGETVSILGPIGRPFEVTRRRPLLIGGGVGMPPMIFVADVLRRERDFSPFAALGSEVPFPFDPRPSQLLVPGMPDGVIATMPLLEDWGIACRLASRQGFAGCYDGFVTEVARHWLTTMDEAGRSEVEVLACGPHPMLAAVVELAREFNLPCQVSLEEFMACAVGGCAGCVVEVATDEGPVMKRVCVDGPVFDGRRVF